jgi:hypothetical protein
MIVRYILSAVNYFRQGLSLRNTATYPHDPARPLPATPTTPSRSPESSLLKPLVFTSLHLKNP